MAEKHLILGDKVNVYMRSNSPVWQCSTFLAGKNHRVSTKEKNLSAAKAFAEEWYFELRGRQKGGEDISGKTFKVAAEKFVEEYVVMTEGERNEKYVQDHQARLRNHLIPFFGKQSLKLIKPGMVQDYRIFRMKGDPEYKPPSRSTMAHEIVTLRQVLKTAVRHSWIDYVPDLSAPFSTSRKITHRAWFSPEEYKQLYTLTREKVKAAAGKSWQHNAQQLHDLVLFLANTGVRPDEVKRLQYRDVEMTKEDPKDQTILTISVRGKRGVGYCKSMPGAVLPYSRLLERNKPEPTDLLFPADHKKQFNRILDENDLKIDREGNRRTFYSLRHSYISFRLLEGADIYQIAKNCRTSVEMIEKHYAAHLKNAIDASAINVRKGKN